MRVFPPSSYRQRAEAAIGRRLGSDEHVHHHSATQLVICTAEYHRWLHARMRERGIPNPDLPWRTQGTVTVRMDAVVWRRIRFQAILGGTSAMALVSRYMEKCFRILDTGVPEDGITPEMLEPSEDPT